MNRLELKGNWNLLKGKVLKKYSEISDDELTRTEGDYHQLVGLFQKRLGKTHEEARDEVDRLLQDEESSET